MIALYGGTFDPPHNGHVRVVASIADMDMYDTIYVHVAYRPKHKKPKAAYSHRVEMAKAAFGFPSTSITVPHDEFTYTSNVIKRIKSLYRNEEIHFFTGPDWDIKTFHNAQYVIDNVKQVIVNIYPVPIPIHVPIHSKQYMNVTYPIDIHSTRIREMIKHGEHCDGLVPYNVIEYARKNKLYGIK